MTRVRLTIAALLALACLAAPGARAAVVSIPSGITTAPGADVVVPITVDPVDGVIGIDLVLEYDETVVTAVGVFKTPDYDMFTLTSNVAVPGEVQISLFAIGDVSGTRDVAWVMFRGLGIPGSSSALTWAQHDLNEGRIASTATDGDIAIVATSEAVLSMPDDANGAPGTTVQVPIRATPANGMLGLDLRVEWNPLVLEAVDATATPFSPSFAVKKNLTTPGVALLSVFGTDDPFGSGPVVQIEFVVLGGLGTETPLDLVQGEANEGGITTTLDDGVFTVCADGDMDGTTVCGGDCDDGDPLIGPTDPVGDTLFVKTPGPPAHLAWPDETIPGPFRLYRGWRKAGDPFAYHHYCITDPDPLVTEEGEDALIPLPTNLFYYLVTREGACGESIPGFDSHAQPIPNLDPCPSAGIDADGDGTEEAIDTCPGLADPFQLDFDGDSYGDSCDNCPVDYNPVQEDGTDGDGVGEVCDDDDDNDGVDDVVDNCPFTRNTVQTDSDADLIGDECDNCPTVFNPDQLDTDHDRIGDACDS